MVKCPKCHGETEVIGIANKDIVLKCHICGHNWQSHSKTAFKMEKALWHLTRHLTGQ